MGPISDSLPSLLNLPVRAVPDGDIGERAVYGRLTVEPLRDVSGVGVGGPNIGDEPVEAVPTDDTPGTGWANVVLIFGVRPVSLVVPDPPVNGLSSTILTLPMEDGGLTLRGYEVVFDAGGGGMTVINGLPLGV